MTTPLEREFDQVLATITKHCDDDTQQLMDVFFGFLSRRTDFFASQLPSQSKQAVLGAFQEQWERLDEVCQYLGIEIFWFLKVNLRIVRNFHKLKAHFYKMLTY